MNSDLFLAGSLNNGPFAIKGLDTVLVRTDTTEAFGYTNLMNRQEIENSELRNAPLVAQQAITDKLDLRVTVVGEEYWCAAVTEGGRGISGDWRLKNQNADFSKYVLPEAIGTRCVALTRRLGLSFAAIDLAFSQDRYYFLELNPTGEWAWLQEQAGFPIAASIAEILVKA